jgi:formyltetrahydrofolate deformylase
MTTYILTVSCPDAVGIVAAVASFLAERDAFITESAHHGDPDTGRFFMRTEFRGAGARFTGIDSLRDAFAPVAETFRMDWSMTDAALRPRVVVAVSKFGHCLQHLLYRWKSGGLPVEIVAVISNHDDMRELVEWHGVAYHHLPVTSGEKAAQEQRFLDIVHHADADMVVLARYMQILSDEMANALSGKCINIHHSFLPSFKGAKPYHQAFARGVKIIGATAHYVTADLDEGPIIEQEVARVDHTQTPDQLVAIGQDIEAMVLARAVQWHAEHRILMNGGKTVVFR